MNRDLENYIMLGNSLNESLRTLLITLVSGVVQAFYKPTQKPHYGDGELYIIVRGYHEGGAWEIHTGIEREPHGVEWIQITPDSVVGWLPAWDAGDE